MMTSILDILGIDANLVNFNQEGLFQIIKREGREAREKR